MEETVLRSDGLIFQYSDSTKPLAFDDIVMQSGQHTLLLGDSGTGKTTLLHLLGGISKPKNGHVYIVNEDMYALSSTRLDTFRAQNIGFIFQDAHLLKNLTIAENVQLAQHLAHGSSDKSAVNELLEKLQLGPQAFSLPAQVSRGQLQRAAIARAIVNKPKLLIADEPTAALDDNNTSRVLELLLDTADKYGATLLIATHDKRIKTHFSHSYNL